MALTKNLMSQIPKDFYRLFGSKYMDYYMTFLVAICEESSRSGSTLGLTEQECRTIINEKLTETTIDWSEERFDEEGSLLTRSNMAAVCLNYFEEWGWLRKDYDETLNSYVVSFPEYSQLYVELFQKLYKEEDSSERESVLAVYSYLFTYSSDAEKNNEILESALQTSRRLSRMLGNMRPFLQTFLLENRTVFLMSISEPQNFIHDHPRSAALPPHSPLPAGSLHPAQVCAHRHA